MSRWFLITVGWLAVILATLGVVLPLLPTTPFLLLAAWCFARSSPRFHHWLLYRSWFGSYIRTWQQHRALPTGTKSKAIFVTILTFAVSLWLVKIWWVRVILLIMLTLLLTFMWRMPVIDLSQQKRR
ncbi:DUF454 family protein [Yersinia intermedia]|uniref:DUF454 family protein n=1 Tax=Yersinia intermedia TaxID=631 RepID=UPI0005E27EA0|nr:DUF454 family protein [Yersinia intermedia]MCB5314424.1 DUF454 family protein [Yersinia intermedia]MCB5321501.1 DUF454 family protein [Yersinia intermedia]MCB5327461.1 DUF454 family protein [Yersinia intermedia]UNK22460.1 DUF454 family protein [Yersinia intermedia]CNB72043.1 Inner membrane protein ybaN [Yersinia intermedia]